MTRILLLVKHAAPRVDPALPPPTWSLSDQGRAVCVPLAAALRAFAPAFAVASTEPKAVETARLVSAALGVPLETAEGLHEQERGTLPFFADPAAFAAWAKDMFARPSERVLAGESADEAHSRFATALAEVLERRPRGNAVVVTHGTVISLLVARALGSDPFALWSGLALPSFVALSLPRLELAGSWGVHLPGP